jgi:hypothetical protein
MGSSRPLGWRWRRLGGPGGGVRRRPVGPFSFSCLFLPVVMSVPGGAFIVMDFVGALVLLALAVRPSCLFPLRVDWQCFPQSLLACRAPLAASKHPGVSTAWPTPHFLI